MGNNIYITIQGATYIQNIKFLPDVINYQFDGIDICGNTDEEGVNAVLHIIVGYNDLEKIEYDSLDTFLIRMIEEMNQGELVAPGGLHFISEDGEEIFPSCCCGFEDWKSIATELMEGKSPWMGHDPFVNYQEENETCLITTRSEQNTYPLNHYEMIYYTKEQFVKRLSELDNDFNEFVEGPLKAYLDKLAIMHSNDFCSAFCKCFKTF